MIYVYKMGVYCIEPTKTIYIYIYILYIYIYIYIYVYIIYRYICIYVINNIYILFNGDLMIFNGFIVELIHSPQKKTPDISHGGCGG